MQFYNRRILVCIRTLDKQYPFLYVHVNLRHYEKVTKFEKISHLFWQNSYFYSVASNKVGEFFRFFLAFSEKLNFMIILLSIFWVSLCVAVMSSSLFNRQKRQKVSRKFPLQVMSSIFWCDIFTVPLVRRSLAQKQPCFSHTVVPNEPKLANN